MIVGMVLLVSSFLSTIFAGMILFKIKKRRYEWLLHRLFIVSIIVDVTCVVIILGRTNVQKQLEYQFWIQSFIRDHNATQLVADFNRSVELSSFVRNRTVAAHDTVLILTCLWLIILVTFTFGTDYVMRVIYGYDGGDCETDVFITSENTSVGRYSSRRPMRRVLDDGESDDVQTRGVEASNPGVMTQGSGYPHVHVDVDVDDPANSDLDYGTDEDYFSGDEDDVVERGVKGRRNGRNDDAEDIPFGKAGRQSRALIPGRLRRHHWDESSTRSDSENPYFPPRRSINQSPARRPSTNQSPARRPSTNQSPARRPSGVSGSTRQPMWSKWTRKLIFDSSTSSSAPLSSSDDQLYSSSYSD